MGKKGFALCVVVVALGCGVSTSLAGAAGAPAKSPKTAPLLFSLTAAGGSLGVGAMSARSSEDVPIVSDPVTGGKGTPTLFGTTFDLGAGAAMTLEEAATFARLHQGGGRHR